MDALKKLQKPRHFLDETEMKKLNKCYECIVSIMTHLNWYNEIERDIVKEQCKQMMASLFTRKQMTMIQSKAEKIGSQQIVDFERRKFEEEEEDEVEEFSDDDKDWPWS